MVHLEDHNHHSEIMSGAVELTDVEIGNTVDNKVHLGYITRVIHSDRLINAVQSEIIIKRHLLLKRQIALN